MEVGAPLDLFYDKVVSYYYNGKCYYLNNSILQSFIFYKFLKAILYEIFSYDKDI